MPSIDFTPNLGRHISLSRMEVEGTTVMEMLVSLNKVNNKVIGYILDDQGQLRKHMNIFIGPDMIRDRVHLTDTVEKNSEVYVVQALSGG